MKIRITTIDRSVATGSANIMDSFGGGDKNRRIALQ